MLYFLGLSPEVTVTWPYQICLSRPLLFGRYSKTARAWWPLNVTSIQKKQLLRTLLLSALIQPGETI